MRALARDAIATGSHPAASFLLARARARIVSARPWLRPDFWSSAAFASAWEDAASFAAMPHARDRLPEILGAHGRYARAQDLVRLACGVEGVSPLLDQNVVELAGSLEARVAVDLRHGKGLLWRLAAERLPAPVAWRPKSEPLHDWLVDRWIADPTHAARTVSRIQGSRALAAPVEVAIVVAAFDRARRPGAPRSLACALVELAAVSEWIARVEARFGA
jgi:hypothetical protein